MLIEFKISIIIILKALKAYQTTALLSNLETMEMEINIGKNIKNYRNKLGLSQKDFANKSGVKYTTLTKIESNVIRKPSVLIMAKLAKTLGVSIDDLIK